MLKKKSILIILTNPKQVLSYVILTVYSIVQLFINSLCKCICNFNACTHLRWNIHLNTLTHDKQRPYWHTINHRIVSFKPLKSAGILLPLVLRVDFCPAPVVDIEFCQFSTPYSSFPMTDFGRTGQPTRCISDPEPPTIGSGFDLEWLWYGWTTSELFGWWDGSMDIVPGTKFLWRGCNFRFWKSKRIG